MNLRNWNIAAAIDNPVALVRSMTRYESDVENSAPLAQLDLIGVLSGLGASDGQWEILAGFVPVLRGVKQRLWLSESIETTVFRDRCRTNRI